MNDAAPRDAGRVRVSGAHARDGGDGGGGGEKPWYWDEEDFVDDGDMFEYKVLTRMAGERPAPTCAHCPDCAQFGPSDRSGGSVVLSIATLTMITSCCAWPHPSLPLPSSRPGLLLLSLKTLCQTAGACLPGDEPAEAAVAGLKAASAGEVPGGAGVQSSNPEPGSADGECGSGQADGTAQPPAQQGVAGVPLQMTAPCVAGGAGSQVQQDGDQKQDERRVRVGLVGTPDSSGAAGAEPPTPACQHPRPAGAGGTSPIAYRDEAVPRPIACGPDGGPATSGHALRPPSQTPADAATCGPADLRASAELAQRSSLPGAAAAAAGTPGALADPPPCLGLAPESDCPDLDWASVAVPHPMDPSPRDTRSPAPCNPTPVAATRATPASAALAGAPADGPGGTGALYGAGSATLALALGPGPPPTATSAPDAALQPEGGAADVIDSGSNALPAVEAVGGVSGSAPGLAVGLGSEAERAGAEGKDAGSNAVLATEAARGAAGSGSGLAPGTGSGTAAPEAEARQEGAARQGQGQGLEGLSMSDFQAMVSTQVPPSRITQWTEA